MSTLYLPSLTIPIFQATLPLITPYQGQMGRLSFMLPTSGQDGASIVLQQGAWASYFDGHPFNLYLARSEKLRLTNYSRNA